MRVDGSGCCIKYCWDSHGKYDKSRKASTEHEKHSTDSAILILAAKRRSER